jgi:hypothetical protein
MSLSSVATLSQDCKGRSWNEREREIKRDSKREREGGRKRERDREGGERERKWLTDCLTQFCWVIGDPSVAIYWQLLFSNLFPSFEAGLFIAQYITKNGTSFFHEAF